MLTVLARGVFAAGLLLLFQSPVIRFDASRSIFLLEGWPGTVQLPPERWAETLIVTVDADDLPPLLGQHRLEGGALAFVPQFPLQPGVRYRAVAKVPGLAAMTTFVEIPRPRTAATTVVSRVYPTTNVLSENHLKFYIHFSAPMSRGFAYDNVALLDESGAKISAPFLELGEELWDPQGRRFTLFFDPGRIKRGLVSQQELGVALEEGRRYTLVIDKGWRDADGNPMAAEFRRSFVAGPADRKPVDLKAWTIRKPMGGSRDILTVQFPEPMDHALLMRELDVVDASGSPLAGSIAVGAEEKSWMFTPDAPWKSGSYAILAGTAVADLSGNMVDRPFEIDIFDKVDNLERVTQSIPFTIN